MLVRLLATTSISLMSCDPLFFALRWSPGRFLARASCHPSQSPTIRTPSTWIVTHCPNVLNVVACPISDPLPCSSPFPPPSTFRSATPQLLVLFPRLGGPRFSATRLFLTVPSFLQMLVCRPSAASLVRSLLISRAPAPPPYIWIKRLLGVNASPTLIALRPLVVEPEISTLFLSIPPRQPFPPSPETSFFSGSPKRPTHARFGGALSSPFPQLFLGRSLTLF